MRFDASRDNVGLVGFFSCPCGHNYESKVFGGKAREWRIMEIGVWVHSGEVAIEARWWWFRFMVEGRWWGRV